MRKIDRKSIKIPVSLSKEKGSPASKERLKAKAHIKKENTKAFTFGVYKSKDVRFSLATLFKGKCVYCESDFDATAPVDIEHFRPKGRVAGETHPGYWWLAADWDNLLSSCIDCNRARKQVHSEDNIVENDLSALSLHGDTNASGKADKFPIRGTRAITEVSSLSDEDPLLIDPTRKDPNDHLRWYLKDGVAIILPQISEGTDREDPYGRTSIDIYGLNRIGLIAARTRVLRYLRFETEEILDLLELSEKIEEMEIQQEAKNLIQQRLITMALNKAKKLRIKCKPEAPYSAMATVFVDDFTIQLNALIGNTS